MYVYIYIYIYVCRIRRGPVIDPRRGEANSKLEAHVLLEYIRGAWRLFKQWYDYCYYHMLLMI